MAPAPTPIIIEILDDGLLEERFPSRRQSPIDGCCLLLTAYRLPLISPVTSEL